MRRITHVSLALVLLLQPLLTVASAQSPDAIISLPPGRANEPYTANIEQVLRDNKLRLDTGSVAASLHWSAAQKALPAGLTLSPSGVISGTPATGRATPYVFRVQVANAATPKSGALTLTLSLFIEQPTVRLVHQNAPQLMSVNTTTTPAVDTPMCDRITTIRRQSEAAATARLQSNAGQPVAIPSQCPPDPTADGKRVTIDARNGYVDGRKRYGKGDKIAVVVDNKNPYVFKYKYSSTFSGAAESAISTFLPLLGGIVAEVAKPPEAAKQEAGNATSPPATGFTNESTGAVSGSCPQLDDLYKATKCASEYAQQTSNDLRQLKNDVNALKETYDAAKSGLQNTDLPRTALCSDSVSFLERTGTAAYRPRVTAVSDQLDDQQNIATTLSAAIDDLLNRLPGCVRAQDVRNIQKYAEQLAATVKKNQDVLDQINRTIKTVDETRNNVAQTLKTPDAFVETHQEGEFIESGTDSITLTLTALAKETTAPKPYTVDLTIGHAPFFSLSGGVVFSTLRKIEYQREQGFQFDAQGKPILDANGLQKTGPVIGLKEGSPTRISPLILLNGRLITGKPNWWLSGIHASVGVTAKNDNKGTDVEFLVGPSFSFIEDKLFVTVGGYAGRQQQLGGGLFKGLAAPQDLGELPIRKNYRWGAGFAVSYKIPMGGGDKKK